MREDDFNIAKDKKYEKILSTAQQQELLRILETRFKENSNRHKDLLMV
ncbi:MAG: hypothetical protein PSV16_09430 [Flavobacterium sp.]|nr:hypothetical protein [Flavobacterium sp.]